MSGIAGIYHLDQRPVDRGLLGRMLDCVPHRGTDAVRMWLHGSIGLGHRQLCTTEEAAREVQPAGNRQGTCRVTFDGRVDNRAELIGRLRPAIGANENPTDVELLLHAYDAWGVDCLKWVIGDFAFALWDSGRQRLFCGRDSYGVRPFYYRFHNHTFTFGSEVRQIFQNPTIPLAINQEKVAESFTPAGSSHLAWRDMTQTYFRGISELPPAHYLIVDPSGIKSVRYWDIDPNYLLRYRRDDDYVEHFYEIFREVVRCRLRSRGGIGAELSGGMDSSSIVCMAQDILASGEAGKRRFATYSIVFDELPCDERPQLRHVVAKYGLESHYVVGDELCGLRNLPPGSDEILDLDGPNEFHLQKPIESLYELAHSHGIRVMLSGEGPEIHLFGGEYVFDSLIRHLRWGDLFSRLSAVAAQKSFPGGLLRAYRSLVHLGLVPLLPQKIAFPLYTKRFHPWIHDLQLPDLFTPTFRAKILEKTAEQRMRFAAGPRFREWGRQAEYHALNPANPLLRTPLPLPIERRFPYFDRRLIEFALAVPPERKYQHVRTAPTGYAKSRVLQRKALVGMLPEPIRCARSKIAFNPVSVRRFTHYKDAFRNMFHPASDPLVAQLGYIRPKRVWHDLIEFLHAIETTRDSRHPANHWVYLVTRLEIWLQALAQPRNLDHLIPVEQFMEEGTYIGSREKSTTLQEARPG